MILTPLLSPEVQVVHYTVFWFVVCLFGFFMKSFISIHVMKSYHLLENRREKLSLIKTDERNNPCLRGGSKDQYPVPCRMCCGHLFWCMTYLWIWRWVAFFYLDTHFFWKNIHKACTLPCYVWFSLVQYHTDNLSLTVLDIDYLNMNS